MQTHDKILAPYYLGRRVLVTGAAGAIGSCLSRRLAGLKACCVLMDDFSQGFRWLLDAESAAHLVEGNIVDETQVKRAFGFEPEVVFHLAAVFANQKSVDDPRLDLMVNGMGTLNILQALASQRKGRLVFASTSSILGNASSAALGEDAPVAGFSSPYQITKGLGEQYCRYHELHYHLEVLRVRLFNSYGPGEVPGRYRNVVPNFFWHARHGRPLPIYGSGEETRDWTFVDDVVDGLLLAGAVEGVAGTVLNLGTGVESKVLHVAETINRLTGNRAGIHHIDRRNWDTVVRRFAMTNHTAALLAHKPRVPIEDGLARTAAWFETHWQQIQLAQTF